MKDVKMIIEMMIKDGLDYHVINDVLMVVEYNGEYWLVDCSIVIDRSIEVNLDEMPKIMRLR